MSVGVMKDYKLKLRDLRASHTLGWSRRSWRGFHRIFFCHILPLLLCLLLPWLLTQDQTKLRWYKSAGTNLLGTADCGKRVLLCFPLDFLFLDFWARFLVNAVPANIRILKVCGKE